MARPENLLTEWSRLSLGVLARSGVSELLVSPGSRSTPFLWAALHEPLLRCHSVIDERAAAFAALGYGRSEGRAAAVLCTSGTAPAHFFPAVIEACHARVPLVLLSADRARVDQNVGAPQTIDQTRLFGDFADYLELGDPAADQRAFERLARVLRSALERAKRGRPLHVNLAADKPLEPRAARTDDERALVRWVDELLATTPEVVASDARIPAHAVEAVTRALGTARRPIFALGPTHPRDAAVVERAAVKLGIPLVGEAGSNAPGALPPEFVVGRRRSDIDCVIGFGSALTSTAFQRWLGETGALQFLVQENSEGDPTSSARLRILGRPKDFAEALAEHASPREVPADFRLARGAVRRALGTLESPSASEPGLVLSALAGLPAGCATLLGNSLSIRLADTVLGALPEPRPHFQVQRGANGIDGLLAGAQGARLSRPKGAAVLLGDVSLSHDLTSLCLFPKMDVPLVVLVLDNDGGRLFDHLPMRSEVESEQVWNFFRTPPHLDLESAAKAFGVRYSAPLGGDVENVVRESAHLPGVTVVHLRADPRETSRFFRALREEYDA